VDALAALAAGLVRGLHIDGLHQFPEGIGVKGLDAHILVRFLDELLNVLVLSFLYFNILPQSDDLGLQLFLLRLIALAKYKSYGEWAKGRERPLTFQQKLCAAIDAALEKQPSDLAAFLSLMEQSGYEVKQQRGAISFRAPGQERFTRLRSSTLGKGYSQKDIEAALSGSQRGTDQPGQRVNLIIDIQSRLQGKRPGYERWAKVFNLKQMAAALAFLQENDLMEYGQLEKKAAEATERFHTLSGQIKSTEAALQTNRELKAATVQYARTRPVFQEYKARKYSRKFLAEHEGDIELYRAACADFKRILGGVKLPKMDELKEEGRELAEKKKKLYAEYRKAREEMREVTAVKANIDYLLGYAEPGREKEQER